jgi:hypothetical protein
MDEVELTDIDEILEYLASVGINHAYDKDGRICLNSEYYQSVLFNPAVVYYRNICAANKNYNLLDNLLINCQICDKYEECNYKIRIMCPVFGNNFSVWEGEYVTQFEDINELIKFMHENYPECIRPADIKIALK